VSTVNWARFRKCPSCAAALGQPCVLLAGAIETNGVADPNSPERSAPHRNRKLRAGYGRG
jgi:hypothetical protein